jgi:hypothetical protein
MFPNAGFWGNTTLAYRPECCSAVWRGRACSVIGESVTTRCLSSVTADKRNRELRDILHRRLNKQ